MKFALVIATLLPLVVSAEISPRLQVINASSAAAELFWLKSDTERISNGRIGAGKEVIVNTFIGHRFVIVGEGVKGPVEESVVCKVPVQGFRFEPPDPQGVPAFYSQRVTAHGFPIVAAASVNPYALKEAAYLIDMMLAKRPDVRRAMIDSGARMCIIGWDQFTTNLPEFSKMTPKDFWDARARGTGGSETDPFCTSAEENLLGYPGDPYSTECIAIHEFAHAIHLRGMSNVDQGFDDRVRTAYQRAMQAGLWKGKYASTSHHEYFAEGVQSWFDNNRENDHDHNHVNTRAELVEYDPDLAALCREVFGDTELRYSKPATRLAGHMQGYEPTKAPTFSWPGRLLKARAEISDSARKRSEAAK